MRVIKIFSLILIIVICSLVLIGFALPAKTHVERKVMISAAPEAVFFLLNNYKNFNRWSPWAERDPKALYEFSGPVSGVGAKMTWQSDHAEVGSGSQEITLSKPYERIEVLLDFGDKGTAVAFFALAPQASGTDLTWGFDTDHGGNIMARYMGLMMDSWVGPDYEKGLAKLKRILEQPAQVQRKVQ